MQTVGFVWIRQGRQDRGVACRCCCRSSRSCSRSLLVAGGRHGADAAARGRRSIAGSAELTGVARADAESRAALRAADRRSSSGSARRRRARRRRSGKLRLRLVQAGYRRDEALTDLLRHPRRRSRSRCSLLFATPLVVPAEHDARRSAGSALGYVLPGMVLGAHGEAPRSTGSGCRCADALDLLVVSVEAGLGLDQALQRVGDELAFAHPELSDELRLINLELRAGKAARRGAAQPRRPHRRRRPRLAGRRC